MSTPARITSVQVLAELHAALCIFRSDAAAALVEAESEAQRTLLWLRHDQAAHWQREIRRRQELLTRAQSELYRNQVAQDGPMSAARASVDQKKALQRAKCNLEEANLKLQAVRRWIRLLERELVLYKGECQALATSLESELPEAISALSRMSRSLEAYLLLAAPPGSESEPAPQTPPSAEPPDAAPAPGDAGADKENHGASHGDQRRLRDASGRDQETADQMGPGPP